MSAKFRPAPRAPVDDEEITRKRSVEPPSLLRRPTGRRRRVPRKRFRRAVPQEGQSVHDLSRERPAIPDIFRRQGPIGSPLFFWIPETPHVTPQSLVGRVFILKTILTESCASETSPRGCPGVSTVRTVGAPRPVRRTPKGVLCGGPPSCEADEDPLARACEREAVPVGPRVCPVCERRSGHRCEIGQGP